MMTTTLLFATWLGQLDGYKDDEIKAAALVVGLAAFAFLAVGGNIGGANVFVYGVRVLKRTDVPPREALNPLGVKSEHAPPREAGPPASPASGIPPAAGRAGQPPGR